MPVDAILDGIQRANIEYEKWSRGWWIGDSGVEGHVVSVVARKLYRQIAGGHSLLMEVPFSDIREWAEAAPRRGRRRRALNGRNRADIVVVDGNDRPIAVIEIKRRWSRRGCFRDLTRLRDLIIEYGPHRQGSLKKGYLAFMVQQQETRHETAIERLNQRVEAISDTVLEEFNARGLELDCFCSNAREYPRRYQTRHDQGNWAHSAVCIRLSA